MSNDVKNPDAKAATDAAQASSQTGAQTGGTQAGSGSEGRASGVGAATDVGMDIGQTEAYTSQLKRLVAMELNHDAELNKVASTLLTRITSNGQDHDDQLRQISLQALQNAVTLANRTNNLSVDHDSRIRAFQEGEVSRTVRHTDLAIDRQWNVDEVAALVAKTPVFLDAIAGAVAAGVAAAIGKKTE